MNKVRHKFECWSNAATHFNHQRWEPQREGDSEEGLWADTPGTQRTNVFTLWHLRRTEKMPSDCDTLKVKSWHRRRL